MRSSPCITWIKTPKRYVAHFIWPMTPGTISTSDIGRPNIFIRLLLVWKPTKRLAPVHLNLKTIFPQRLSLMHQQKAALAHGLLLCFASWSFGFYQFWIRLGFLNFWFMKTFGVISFVFSWRNRIARFFCPGFSPGCFKRALRIFLSAIVPSQITPPSIFSPQTTNETQPKLQWYGKCGWVRGDLDNGHVHHTRTHTHHTRHIRHRKHNMATHAQTRVFLRLDPLTGWSLPVFLKKNISIGREIHVPGHQPQGALPARVVLPTLHGDGDGGPRPLAGLPSRCRWVRIIFKAEILEVSPVFLRF